MGTIYEYNRDIILPVPIYFSGRAICIEALRLQINSPPLACLSVTLITDRLAFVTNRDYTISMKENPSLSLQDIEAEEKFHKDALAELAVAKRVLMRRGQAASASMPEQHQTTLAEVLEAMKPPPEGPRRTKKAIVLSVISLYPQGATTAAIVSGAIALGFQTARVSNVSPKLSMYKSEGLLTLEEGLWKITDKGLKELES